MVGVSDLFSSKALFSSYDEDAGLEDVDCLDEGEALVAEYDSIGDDFELLDGATSSDDVDNSDVELVELSFSMVTLSAMDFGLSAIGFFEQPVPAANIMTASKLVIIFFMRFSNFPGFLSQFLSVQPHLLRIVDGRIPFLLPENPMCQNPQRIF